MQASRVHCGAWVEILSALRHLLAWCVLLGLAAWPAAAAEVAGQGTAPGIGPPAAWVMPLPFERLSATAPYEPGEDSHCLLLEWQIDAGADETFCHSVRQVLTIAGVQNGANLSVDFDPSYQSLTFHWVRIWRGTNLLNRLERDKIRLIQPERELDQHLYTGKQTAVLVLDDVRVGDVIDQAYSTRGANPIREGKFFGAVPVQAQESVDRLTTRLLWPESRRLCARNHQCAVKPAVARQERRIDYTWDFRRVPRLRLQDALPGWYDPEPWVQLSEFQTWAEVNQWALGLFQNTENLSPELLQRIDPWRRINSREDQVLAVLRFVQDEVRYFGIEIGANSHKPSPPSAVFSRRFGDCKDKSLLFVTALRALGIEAYPVLVNSTLRQAIETWQPSAGAFDHVIAQVRIGGQAWWLDPTDRYQRGPLTAHYLPPYGRGLVVHPRTGGLSVIPHTTGLPRTTTTEYFQLRGKLQPADLKVVTVAEGLDAELLRQQLATTPREDLEKAYLKFYAGLYPTVKMTRPLLCSDNEQRNRIEVTESYVIERLWVQSDRDRQYRCQFFPYAINALLKQPADTRRTMPLGVRFPQHQVLRTEIALPEAWPADAQNKQIVDPAFTFRLNLRSHGNKLTLEHEYRSLADSVPVERAAEYLQRLEQASQSLGYALRWQ
jgi:transglutaminase-like putative cysteine protease